VFERYSEAARQLIFHAHNEAAQCGSPVIETEHFLLALLREDNSLLRRLLPAEGSAIVENELRESLSSSQPSGQSFSHGMKRVLAYGAEASERLHEPRIDSVHSLLGLLREENCPASQILHKHGITTETVLREIGEPNAVPVESPRPRPTRETLNALVASLPEGAVEQACRALERFQEWPPRPPQKPARIAEIQKEMSERFRAALRPGQGMMGGSGGGWTADAEGRVRSGSFSSGRMEDGAQVTETHRFFEGHEITIIERLRIKEDKKLLSYSGQIGGPNRQYPFEFDFEIG
jgi:hypothetical protein